MKRKTLHIALCTFFLVITANRVFPQHIDTSTVFHREFITDQLENITENIDLNIDYSDLLDKLSYYRKNPIAINDKDEIDELERLHLLNVVQVNNIKKYRDKYGDILSGYEIQHIDGFNKETVERILPFITFKKVTNKEPLSLNKALKYGHHELFFRYRQQLEKSSGYLTPVDSAVYKPGSVYLGKPFKLYTRYSFSYKQRIHAGVTTDKDPGEIFLKTKLPDTLKSIIGNKATDFFDFYSAHLYLADIGFVKKIAVGDYHIEFGQGLNLWSGLSFGKSAQGIFVKKYGRGIRPNTSVNENRFFRGVASTIKIKRLEITGFYSNNNIDANLVETDTLDQPLITTIQETGLHRTINELKAKNAINIQAFGSHLNVTGKIFNIGFTGYHTILNKPFLHSEKLYKKFAFTGKTETHYGSDFNITLNKVDFFGEVSLTQSGGYALITGVNTGLSDRFLLTVAYRNYSKNFHNFYAMPFGATQNGSNEEGIYMGFTAYLTKTLSLSGYIDRYRFPWLRYNIDFPSYGNDYVFQLNITPSHRVVAYIKYRYKYSQKNLKKDYEYLSKVNDINRHNLRFNVTWELVKPLIMKNRVEYVFYQTENMEKSKGYLFYQDVLYRPENIPVAITLRYALYYTDSWDSRIYAYENDILYAFSIPAYYGNGQRVYGMISYKMNRHFSFWLRFARTTLFDKNHIGSGSDMVNENHKTEIKFQVRVKY